MAMDKNLKKSMIDKLCAFYQRLYPNQEQSNKLKNLIRQNQNKEIELCPTNKSELRHIIALSMLLFGKHCNLNFINIEKISNLSYLFSEFNPFGELKDVIINMYEDDLIFLLKELDVIKSKEEFKPLFFNKSVGKTLDFFKHDFFEVNKIPAGRVFKAGDYCFNVIVELNYFNGFINEWNTVNVEIMKETFSGSHFNQHPLQLDLSNVTSTVNMFRDSHYSKDFKGLNSQKINSARGMFNSPHWRGNIELDLTNANDLEKLFHENIDVNLIDNIVFNTSITRNGESPNNRFSEPNNNLRLRNSIPFDKLKDVKNPYLIDLIKNLKSREFIFTFLKYYKLSFRRVDVEILKHIASTPFVNKAVKKSVLKEVETILKEIIKMPKLYSKHLNECVEVLSILQPVFPKDVAKIENEHKFSFVRNNLNIRNKDKQDDINLNIDKPGCENIVHHNRLAI